MLYAWDFHGVLEKDNEYAVLEITNRVLKEFSVKRQMTIKECRDWYGLSWHDYYQNLFPKQSHQTYIKMYKRSVEIQETESIIQKYIKPMDGADKTLKWIKEQGDVNIVISNSEPGAIKKFVEYVKLEKFFKGYVGVDSRHEFPTEKVESKKGYALKKYLAKHQFDKIFVIGDNYSDIAAARTVKAKTFLFTGSKTFSSYKLIKEWQPDYVISKLAEIINTSL